MTANEIRNICLLGHGGSGKTTQLKDRLNENINSIYAMIDSLSEEELFKPHMRKWADEATKTAVWEVYKFIPVSYTHLDVYKRQSK